MAFRVEISSRAYADLDRLTAYIRTESSSETAERWFDGIWAAIHSLAENPFRCALAPESDDLDMPIHLLLFGRRNRQYKIYFEVEEVRSRRGTVRILHVRHWARRALDFADL
jgi:plasmid stabilization system protein ParE